MNHSESPTVFISYAHESESHKDWVRRLAGDLVKNGVRTILDQWELRIGDDLGAFMERSISKAKYVVIVCTERFAQKANDRIAGVGYEQAMFIGELLADQDSPSRFLPVLRSGEPSMALPYYLRSRLFVDLREETHYAQGLEQLLRRLFAAPRYTPPELGEPPIFPGSAIEHPSSTSPRAWILVAGTGNIEEIGAKERETCAQLGSALAEANYGLVTGGWPGVDELTLRSFAQTLTTRGKALEDRVIQVVAEDMRPPLPVGKLVLVHRGEEEWTELIAPADAVVLVGGMGGTWTTAEYALRLGRSVFPLVDTGGDAERFYLHMLQDWPSVMNGVIDKRRFAVLTRSAPGVVSLLFSLLGDWQVKR